MSPSQSPTARMEETAQGWMDARQEAPTQPTSGNLFVPEAGPSVWKLKNYCMTPEWAVTTPGTIHKCWHLPPGKAEMGLGTPTSSEREENPAPPRGQDSIKAVRLRQGASGPCAPITSALSSCLHSGETSFLRLTLKH